MQVCRWRSEEEAEPGEVPPEWTALGQRRRHGTTDGFNSSIPKVDLLCLYNIFCAGVKLKGFLGVLADDPLALC